MKPILFIDFDGTLCHDRFWRSLESQLYVKVQEYLFILNRDLVREWMLGKHSSEDINMRLSKDLGIPFERLWDTFINDCETMKIAVETLSLISSLRQKFYCVLITDNMDCFQRFTVPALKLNIYFDEIVDSYTEKCFKNDFQGKLFTDTIRRYKSNMSECILIDNSKNICTLFEKIGGTAFLVNEERPLTYWLTKKLPLGSPV